MTGHRTPKSGCVILSASGVRRNFISSNKQRRTIRSNAPEAGTYLIASRRHCWRGFHGRHHPICLFVTQTTNRAGTARSFKLPAANPRDCARIDLRLSPHGTAAQIAGCANCHHRRAIDDPHICARLDRYSPQSTNSTAIRFTAKRSVNQRHLS